MKYEINHLKQRGNIFKNNPANRKNTIDRKLREVALRITNKKELFNILYSIPFLPCLRPDYNIGCYPLKDNIQSRNQISSALLCLSEIPWKRKKSKFWLLSGYFSRQDGRILPALFPWENLICTNHIIIS